MKRHNPSGVPHHRGERSQFSRAAGAFPDIVASQCTRFNQLSLCHNGIVVNSPVVHNKMIPS